MYRILIYMIAAVLLSGCIKSAWTNTTSATYFAQSQNISLELPLGWMISGRDDILLVTRDGERLQHILAGVINVDDELSYTKKKFRRGMVPLEQAEVLFDNMASNPNMNAFTVEKKKPARVDGHEAFRADFTFKDGNGLLYRGIQYGFMQNNIFYSIRFVAPNRHFFNRDKAKFEASVKTVKLLI